VILICSPSLVQRLDVLERSKCLDLTIKEIIISFKNVGNYIF
jgi:hypothetical protein